MLRWMIDELLNGSRWFQTGVVAGGLLIGASMLRAGRGQSPRETLLRRLHLFYAAVIALQAVGHMVAVTIRSNSGTLTTTTPLAGLYGIGLIYLLPSLALVAFVWRDNLDNPASKRRVMIVDLFLAVALLVAIFPGPLAIPAIFNIVALRRDTRKAARVVVTATIAVYAAMFVASFFFGGP